MTEEIEIPTPEQMLDEQKRSFQSRVDKFVEYLVEHLKTEKSNGSYMGEAPYFLFDDAVLQASIAAFEARGWQVKRCRRIFGRGTSLRFFKK